MMDEHMVLPASIVLAAFLIAFGLWMAGNAIGSGLRCQAVSDVPVSSTSNDSLFGSQTTLGGAARPEGC
jgi:hypothetical protein